VKKISTYITKKVADRLDEIFKNDRPQLEENWDSLKIFVEYGLITEEKFYERAFKFVLVKDVENKCYTLDEYKTLIESNQTDKDGNLIYLYTTNKNEQYAYISDAKDRAYNVLVMDGQLDVHFVNKLEQHFDKSRFVRVDSDVIDNLIKKSDSPEVTLTDEERNALVELFKSAVPPIEKTDFVVGFERLGDKGNPVTITQNEFMRRMKEMAEMQGGMSFYGDMPLSYSMTVNLDSPLIKQVVDNKENSKDAIGQMVDLALLTNGLLKGEALSKFVKRSLEMIIK
jgi:molecular chaperone HtpG